MDYYYLILVLPMVIFTLIAQIGVKSAFSGYSKVRASNGITGAEAAERVLASHGLYNIPIERVAGELTDHYDPKANIIRLSQNVYDGCSVAAVGVACHEAGHALQYAENYGPIRLRMNIIPICSLCSNMAMPLIMLGFIFDFLALAAVGVIAFGVAVLFQVVTLPVEFNASKRALEAIETSCILTDSERKGAKAVLRAAAMTYVASLSLALVNLLRFILILNGGRRRK